MPQVFASYALKVLFTVAVNYAIVRVQQAMQKRPTRVLQKVDANYAGGLEPRRKLYGFFRAGGLEVMPSVTTSQIGETAGLWLHKCQALSDGPIESIDAMWFGNDRVDASLFSGGSISSGPYSGYAQVFTRLGTASQTPIPEALAVANWTEYHRGDGIAYVYSRYRASNEVWTAGQPQVLVEGQGVLCYDPRLDSSPGANPTNPSYIAFSINPAIILADYLRWVGISPSRIDWDDVVACANSCDEAVTVPDGLGGAVGQQRFTCSIEVYAPQTVEERDATIAMLARAMMGACIFSGVKWHMRAGVYSSPVGTIADDDFLGEAMSIKCAVSRRTSGLFNKVRGSYVDQSEQTSYKAFPEIYSSAYEADDGESIATDVEFKTARSVYEAQRNAILLLRQTRNRTIIAAQMRWRCAKHLPWDIVTVTNSKAGWVNQPARITRMKIRQDFTVEMQFQKIASTDFTDPIAADYTVPGAVGPPVSAPDVPNPPRNLAASGQPSGIIFTWDPPLNPPVGVLYRLYEYTASTPFSSAVQVGPDTAQNSIVIPKADTTTRYYWVVAVNPATAAVSTNAPPSNGVPGSAISASSALSAIVYPGSASANGFTSTLTTNTVSVTATGGTPGYTYATTFPGGMGGSGITILNGTTTTPSFEATGLSEGETRTGTARIRVTDGVAATFDVFVAVTITRQLGVTLISQTITGTGGSMSAAVSTITVGSDGNVTPTPGTAYQWKDPAASAADYDVRFTLGAGVLYTSSSPTGTWLQLNSSRTWVGIRLPSEGAGTSSQSGTLEIRLHASPFTVLASEAITLEQTIF